jgi:phage/plasmid-like protein (TIGR03299 family)
MHELDITAGVASFADSRTDAWHQLGQQVGHCMTAEEVLTEAHLDNWNVRKMAIQTAPHTVVDDDGVTSIPALAIPDRWANVRTNPINGQIDYLGTVGRTYKAIQNEETTKLLNALVGESGAHFETAGALYGGKQVFVTMQLREAIHLQGHHDIDTTEVYLSALNRHDGRGAFRFIITPVRIVCANTQDAAVGAAESSFSVWHTGGAHNTLGEARQALHLTHKYIEDFALAQQKLFEQPMTTAEFTQFAEKLTEVTTAETDRVRTNRQETANKIVKVWSTSRTLENIAGTRLAAYNTVTEYVDFIMDIKGGDSTPEDMRALRTVSSLGSTTTNTLKLDAFKLLTRA